MTPSTFTHQRRQRPLAVPWRSGQVALGIGLVSVAALIASQIILVLTSTENPALISWLTSLILGVIIIAVVWLLALRPYRVPLSMLGLKPLGVPKLKDVGLTLGALLVSLGATALYATLVRLSGLDILEPPEIPTSLIFPGAGAILTFLALALWTPISEEIFFRGFIFAGLSSRWGIAGAMLISALIFAILHDPLILVAPFDFEFYASHSATGVLIPIFITALLLAWLYWQTGSLWASIAAHAGQNAAALVATLYGV